MSDDLHQGSEEAEEAASARSQARRAGSLGNRSPGQGKIPIEGPPKSSPSRAKASQLQIAKAQRLVLTLDAFPR